MSLQKARRVVGILLLLFSAGLLIGGLSAGKLSRQTIELSPGDMALPGAEATAGGQSGMALEARLLELSAPKSLCLGDDGSLRLAVSLPTAAPGSQSPASAVYQAYHLVLQAHLDMPGVARTPTGEISQAMLLGQPQVFLWYVRPSVPGLFSGKVWLHLLYRPRSGAREQRRLLAALPVELQVVTLLGMSGSQARLWGSLGLALGVLLGLDGFLYWSLEKLARRSQRKASESRP